MNWVGIEENHCAITLFYRKFVRYKDLMKINTLFSLVFLFLTITHLSWGASQNKSESIETLNLEVVRDLKLSPDTKSKTQDFISAASGLIKVNDRFYVVSDTDSFLFSFNEAEPTLSSFKLLDLVVTDKEKKKVEKADFESLTPLSPKQWPPYGAIVAWPSASNPKRMKAVTVPFNKDGQLDKPIVSDILPLAYRILPHAKEMNIEGILVDETKVFFFQRGNSKKSKNGIAEISLTDFIKGLKTSDWSGKLKFENVKLGTFNGVKLGFADATYTPYGLLALATAEDTESAVGDGHIHGTVLVRVVGKKSEILGKFEPRTKLEGFSVQETADGLELYLVEDADSSEKPSRLFRTKLSKAQLETIKSR